jgi:hypothetical protein
MTRRIRTALVCTLMSLAAGATAWAHHSFAAAFDLNKPVTVQGTIVQVRLENPHSWFFLDVKDASGKVERWAFEAGTPSGMVRNGFKPDLIKKGVEVTIKGFHAKDPAQNMGMLRELVMADGRVFGMFGSQQGPSAQ